MSTANVTVNVEALFSKLLNGEVKAGSQFKLRNENAQGGNRMSRINRLKRALDKNSKLLFPMELAIPFNPATGKEDEEYNADSKWRPLVTATTAAMVLKMYANENPEAKAEFERRANVENWDTSNTGEFTEQDRQVLRIYRVPRIFTIPVFDVRDKLIGGDYSKQFMVDIVRDPVTNKIVGETPVFLEIAKLYQDLTYEEWSNIKESVDNAKANKPYELKSKNPRINQIASLNLANITEKDLEEVRKEVYGEIPVGRDRPANYVILYEFPLDGEMNLQDIQKLSGNITSQDMERCMVYTSLTKEIQTNVFDQFKTKWVKQDQYWDFYEVDMACPMTGSCTDDAMQIGLKTRYERPINPIRAAIKDDQDNVDQEKSSVFFGNLSKLITDALNEEQKLEQRFLQSTYIEKYDDVIAGQLVDSLGQAKLLSSNPFLTKKVAQANKNILTIAYGKKANQFFLEMEAGISDNADGVLDEDAAKKEADAVNITELLVGKSGEAPAPAEQDNSTPQQNAGNMIQASLTNFEV